MIGIGPTRYIPPGCCAIGGEPRTGDGPPPPSLIRKRPPHKQGVTHNNSKCAFLLGGGGRRLCALSLVHYVMFEAHTPPRACLSAFSPLFFSPHEKMPKRRCETQCAHDRGEGGDQGTEQQHRQHSRTQLLTEPLMATVMQCLSPLDSTSTLAHMVYTGTLGSLQHVDVSSYLDRTLA